MVAFNRATTLALGTRRFLSSSLSPDDTQIAATSIDGSVHPLDVETMRYSAGSLRSSHLAYARSERPSPQGLGPYVRVWDLATHKEVMRRPRRRAWLTFAFLLGRQTTGRCGRSGPIHLWHLDTRQQQDILPTKSERVVNAF